MMSGALCVKTYEVLHLKYKYIYVCRSNNWLNKTQNKKLFKKKKYTDVKFFFIFSLLMSHGQPFKDKKRCEGIILEYIIIWHHTSIIVDQKKEKTILCQYHENVTPGTTIVFLFSPFKIIFIIIIASTIYLINNWFYLA